MVKKMDAKRLSQPDFGRVQVRLYKDADKIAHHWLLENHPQLYRDFRRECERVVLPLLYSKIALAKRSQENA